VSIATLANILKVCCHIFPAVHYHHSRLCAFKVRPVHQTRTTYYLHTSIGECKWYHIHVVP